MLRKPNTDPVKNTKECISIEEGMIELCNKKKKEAEKVLTNSSTSNSKTNTGVDEEENISLNAETLYKLLNYTQTVKNAKGPKYL